MLTKEEFAELKTLSAKKDLTDEGKARLNELLAKKKEGKRKEKKHRVKGEIDMPWGNHFPWWNKYPALLKDASNIAFNWIPGTGLNGVLGESANLIETAGAMAIDVANVYGAEDKITDPINVQSRNIWLAMHRKYRGLQTYQAADLGAVLIAGVEFVSTLAEIERLYGVINYYSLNNRNLPYAMLRAMGVSNTLADNIRLHLADFRYGINQIIMRAQNILVPKDMSVVASKISTFGYLYADHKSPRSQVYVFRNIALGTFSATLPGGSAVIFDRSKVISVCSTYDQVVALLQEQVQALVEDDDVNKIYSDLVAYLGNENFLNISLLPESYLVVPQYDESVLHKIHNCKSLGFSVSIDSETGCNLLSDVIPSLYTHQVSMTPDPNQWAITQKDNVLCTKVSLTDKTGNGSFVTSSDDLKARFFDQMYIPGLTGFGRPSLLDTYDKPMDEEHITEGMLYKCAFETDNNGGFAYVSKSCGFELICGFKAYVNRKGVITEYVVHQYSYTSGYLTDAQQKIFDGFAKQSILTLSQFDWAPIFYRLVDDDAYDIYADDTVYESTGMTPTPVPGVSFGCDIDNCRYVDYTEMFRVHETCILSGFYTSIGITSNTETK